MSISIPLVSLTFLNRAISATKKPGTKSANETIPVTVLPIVRVNGRLNTLTHPAIAENGAVYIPLTLITDYYGWNLFNAGDGGYAIGYDSISTSGVNAAKAIFN